ncbi:MAG: hypothetical protein IPK19_25485 [Chloroflexi bacterium]|nr:hypothetical protein [Chloroflexota bacterium]
MIRNRVFKGIVLLVVALLALGAVAVVLAQSETAPQTIRVEVAEDGMRFVFGQDHLFDDGMPAYGTPFVTQGYLYPEGTLNGSNGVNEDGSPEFPDQVIGQWNCYGYMIGDGAPSTTGQWVISTQIYTLYEHDNAIVVTNGYELADLNVPAARAISGGTGAFSTARGEQSQTLLGFTPAMGVNLSVEFQFAQ